MPHIVALGMGRSLRVATFESTDGMKFAPYLTGSGNSASIYDLWNMSLFHKPIGDLEASFFRIQGAPSFSGDSSVHGQSSVFLLRVGAVLGQSSPVGSSWVPSDGDLYRGASSRVCCIGTGVNGVDYTRQPGALFSEWYESIGSGVYATKRAKRSGLIICGEFENNQIKDPWICASLHSLQHGNPLEAYATLDELLAMLPTKILDPFARHTDGQFYDLCLEQSGVDTRVCSFSSVGGMKLAVAKDRQSGEWFAVCFAGGVSDDFVTTPVGLIDADAYSLYGACGTRTPVASGADWSVSAAGVCAIAAPVSEAVASRRDAARRVSRSSIVLGGVENTTPSSMVALREDLDYGSVASTPFFSRTIQTLQAKDGNFERPQWDKMNVPSIISVGSKHLSPGFDEDVPDDESQTFRKADATSTGVLADEPLAYVRLRSAQLCALEHPVDDDSVCFPVIQKADQEKFLFREKNITGTGIRFIPRSSNSFATPRTSFGASQVLAYNPEPSSTSSSPAQVGIGTPKASAQPPGKYYYAGTSLIPGLSVNTIQDVSPANALFPVYDEDALSLYTTFDPPLVGTYPPAAEYDEQSYLAGAVASKIPSSYNFGRVKTGSPPPTGNSFGFFGGYQDAAIDDLHPTMWNYAASSSLGTIGSSIAFPRLFSSLDVRPHLSGKEYQCQRETVRGMTMQAGVFHCLDAGTSFTKTATRNFAGKGFTRKNENFTVIAGGTGYEFTSTVQTKHWTGSVAHDVSFSTDRVEIYVRWRGSLQSPGPYKVAPPFANEIDGVNVENGKSRVSPRMFVKQSQIDQATPILIADVWVRAVGTVNVSSNYTLPEAFGSSGTYTHKTLARTHTQEKLEKDLPDVSIGHRGEIAQGIGQLDVIQSWVKGEPVSSDALDWKYLNGFIFNRSQTQRLLDGETVEPTYWFLDNEGSAVESEPVCVHWHNTTFGTYKLQFRLIMD